MAAHDILLETLKSRSDKVERRLAERQPAEDFFSHRWNGSELIQEAVKDISSTGIYIFTEQRWEPGTLLTLSLQRRGPLELSSDRRIEVTAKVVRSGNDGVGLAFELKDDAELRQWTTLREKLIEQAKPEDMLSLVRLVAAVVFLSRICPGEAEKFTQLLLGQLSRQKLLNAVAILLKAENLLAGKALDDSQRANPDLVVRLLEDGSCTEEDWLKDFWGGLLAMSCRVDAKDASSLIFVESFSKLTTYLCRISSQRSSARSE